MVMDQEPMESLPAPDIVGREFVRQYYTLLNQAPEHAHRFYNSNSYFVHGAMTKPAIGQAEIHQKIQQLNFRDCHAKISQVDSQVTLGNGVVVQVSGELSNDGEPMRRFSQTFVLGTQSPKKYYVRNDIFRYQDMLQTDEEPADSPEKEETTTELPQEVPAATPHYYPPVSEQNIPPVLPITQPAAPQPPQPALSVTVNVNGSGIHHEESHGVADKQHDAAPVIEAPVAVNAPVMNGGPMIPEMTRLIAAPGLPDPPQNDLNRSVAGHISSSSEDSPPKGDNLGMKEDVGWDEGSQDRGGDGNEQKVSFANLLKTGRGARSGGRRGTGSYSGQLQPSFQDAGAGVDLGPSPPSGPPSGAPISDLGGEARRHSMYPDSHQVFIGILPSDAKEVELRAVFSEFGRVVDLRINASKHSVTKSNYGFVTFEDAASAALCIQNKPIKIRTGGKTVELNVEEKKPMSRNGPAGRGRGSSRGAPRGGGPSFGGRGAAPPSRNSYSSVPPRR